ncbi:calcium/proton exchanger Cax [Chthonomonas calidirosea]|nr:calcium/proton exchanger Cax [Chthonomonas calidirosea]
MLFVALVSAFLKPVDEKGLPMYRLLIFVPVSLVLYLLHVPPLWVFLTSGLALIPLAGLLGEATESLAASRGPLIGGLLNATFGNATEIVITLVALQHNELTVVRASLIGSIIGNVLLVLGFSALLGGFRQNLLTFSSEVAQAHITSMSLAVIALLTPALLVQSAHLPEKNLQAAALMPLSLWVSAVLLVLYGAGLFFALRTHRHLFPTGETQEKPKWSATKASFILFASTVVVALESELLIGLLEPALHILHFNRMFAGLILLPILGNAAEHSTAITMALRNQMAVSLDIVASSSIQIAMFVTPVAVFSSLIWNHPLTILFTASELVALTMAILIAIRIVSDGQTHWLEGAQLLGVYTILAITFYFVGG